MTQKRKRFWWRKLNNRGVMDDLADFLFTIITAIFLFMFISAALSGSIKNSHEKSLAEVTSFTQTEAALNNIRVAMYEGYNLEKVEDLDAKLYESKVLGGRVITTCADYTQQGDCDTNVVGIEGSCQWNIDKKACAEE